jgi:hypothetical protein
MDLFKHLLSFCITLVMQFIVQVKKLNEYPSNPTVRFVKRNKEERVIMFNDINNNFQRAPGKLAAATKAAAQMELLPKSTVNTTTTTTSSMPGLLNKTAPPPKSTVNAKVAKVLPSQTLGAERTPPQIGTVIGGRGSNSAQGKNVEKYKPKNTSFSNV